MSRTNTTGIYRPFAKGPDGNKVQIDIGYALRNDFGKWLPVEVGSLRQDNKGTQSNQE